MKVNYKVLDVGLFEAKDKKPIAFSLTILMQIIEFEFCHYK